MHCMVVAYCTYAYMFIAICNCLLLNLVQENRLPIYWHLVLNSHSTIKAEDARHHGLKCAIFFLILKVTYSVFIFKSINVVF